MPNTDHEHDNPPDRSRERQRVETSEAAAEVEAEIVALHQFFVAWFRGSCDKDDDTFQRGFARRFDPGFVWITPGAATVPLAQLTRSIHGAYASNPAFDIEIRNVVLRRELGKLCLVTYEEWQRNAKNSTPADNARLSTALLQRDRVGPGGFAWLHLHETGL